ncbi:LLM class flavin-dependent oxidoreductase [Streptomyces sp. NPDC054919]
MTNPVFGSNRLKLGVFATNGRGPSQTLVPEAHSATSWDMSLRTSQVADQAGFEAIVAFARWKGYLEDRPDHRSGDVMDPFTWAAGIAQATEHAAVFATSHAPTMHPIVAAKQATTIDMISGGRFVLNVVGGWNRAELEMFGAPLKEHNQRYDHLAEWLQVLERLWTEDEEFDHHGEFYDVVKGVSLPKPVQKPHPPIMNAGGSERGRRFAAEHADLCFVNLTSEDPEKVRTQVRQYREAAREEFGREVKVWTNAFVVQRDTQEEADAYLRRYAVEYEDTESVDAWLQLLGENARIMPPEALAAMRLRFAAGVGGFPLVGTAERIAERLETLSDAGIDGVLMTWVDYDEGLGRFTKQVLPLLEKAGLRAPFKPGLDRK